MPPKNRRSAKPISCEIEVPGAGGCCGGSGWNPVNVSLGPAAEDDSWELVVDGSEEGQQTHMVHGVTWMEHGQKLSLSGSFPNNISALRLRPSASSANINPTLKKFQDLSSEFSTWQKRQYEKNKHAGAPAGKVSYGATNTTEAEANPMTEPELDDTGIMWVGTIFAYDADKDGKINCDNPAEYKLESQVMTDQRHKPEDAPLQELDMDAATLESTCKKVIEGTLLKNPKYFDKLTNTSSKSLSFFLKGGTDPDAPRVQAFCSAKKFHSWCTIVFILASEMTEKTASGELAKDILGGSSDVLGGLLLKHFKDACQGFTDDKPRNTSIFHAAGVNPQKVKAYEAELQKRIEIRNKANSKNLHDARKNEKLLEELKANLLKNMDTIQERSIKIKRNKKAAEATRNNAKILNTKAVEVYEVACWKHCKWILCSVTLITLIITAVVVILYFYLKKK